jgi:hypothetical protein
MRARVLAVLALLTLGEIRLLDRLLYERGPQLDFVTESVKGVLSGHPVFENWQQRVVGPMAVAVLERVSGLDRAGAVQLFGNVMIAAAVLVLYALVRRRGAAVAGALAAVVTFGLLRSVTAYSLEYPWDAIDVLLFLAFGAWAAGGGRLIGAWPLLLVGTFNHETVLFLPLWYLLSPLEPGARRWRDVVEGASVALAMVAIITGARHWLYRGRPELPGQEFDPSPPLLGHPVHLGHNLTELFVNNWGQGRWFESVLVLSSLIVFVLQLWRRATLRPAMWALLVMTSIFVVGYGNELRLYVPLAAFFITYGWPVRDGAYLRKLSTSSP